MSRDVTECTSACDYLFNYVGGFPSYNPSPPSREKKKGNVLESARWATLFPELSVVLNPHSARLSLHINYDTPI